MILYSQSRRLLLFSHPVVFDSFVTPCTVAHQAPLSVGFSRQEYWSEFPSLGNLPDPGIEPMSPVFAGDAEDSCLIPGSGRSPREGNGNLLQYSWLENLWTEEPGGLQFMGSQRVGHNQATNTFTFRKASPFLIPLDCSSIGNIYHIKCPLKLCVAGFPGSSIVKNPTCQCRRHEFDLCSRRSRMPRRA